MLTSLSSISSSLFIRVPFYGDQSVAHFVFSTGEVSLMKEKFDGLTIDDTEIQQEIWQSFRQLIPFWFPCKDLGL